MSKLRKSRSGRAGGPPPGGPLKPPQPPKPGTTSTSATPATPPAALAGNRPAAGIRLPWTWIAVLSVFIVALGVRLLAYHQMHAWPLLEKAEVLADTHYYDMMARQVAGGDLLGNHPYFLSPAYYYALGLGYALFGAGAATALVLQCILGALTCVLAYAIGRKVFGPTAGWIAGGLLALYGYLVYQNLVLLPDSVILFLNLAALWVLIDLEQRLSSLRAFIGGALIGLAAAARANALLLVPAVGLFIWFAHRRAGRKRIMACAALAAGCLLVVAPFTIRNYIVSKEFVLLTTTGGRNFWKGNGPGATGSHRFLEKDEWSQGLLQYLTGGQDAQVAIADSERLTSQTWSHIASHPVQTAGLWIKKLGLFFHARELGIRDHFYFAQTFSSLLRGLWVSFAWIAPLGLLGLWSALRARRGRLLSIFLLVQVASFVAIFVIGRYRLVAAALLAVLAAYQLLWWSERIRQRQWRPLLWTAVALAALLLVTNRPLREFPRNAGFGDQYAALGFYYAGQRDCAKALPAYQNALASPWIEQPSLEGMRNKARYHVGLCQFQLGRPLEARATIADLRERLALDSGSPDAELQQATELLWRHIEQATAAEGTGD